MFQGDAIILSFEENRWFKSSACLLLLPKSLSGFGYKSYDFVDYPSVSQNAVMAQARGAQKCRTLPGVRQSLALTPRHHQVIPVVDDQARPVREATSSTDASRHSVPGRGDPSPAGEKRGPRHPASRDDRDRGPSATPRTRVRRCTPHAAPVDPAQAQGRGLRTGHRMSARLSHVAGHVAEPVWP